VNHCSQSSPMTSQDLLPGNTSIAQLTYYSAWENLIPQTSRLTAGALAVPQHWLNPAPATHSSKPWVVGKVRLFSLTYAYRHRHSLLLTTQFPSCSTCLHVDLSRSPTSNGSSLRFIWHPQTYGSPIAGSCSASCCAPSFMPNISTLSVTSAIYSILLSP
jgi:hypothetical protein